ncbi:hypothetical protein RHSIM_Rhsim02G0175500 [Rhododendron simsii]|uniref:Uncharacterized protein n=1 Tax=Rhododendron simsii TaxID=118357 RepID=A0A834LWD6_RHOSS|nr:hypothetical protein RHSIM_Rhsim02G0175500 [Rhododendron simsii]
MEIEQTIEGIGGSSIGLVVEQGEINMTDQENREIGQNDMLEQLGWKFESREKLVDTLRQFFAIQGLDDGFWVLEVKNGSHNHEPSSDMVGHPSFRRFSKEEIMTIEELTRSGVPPRQILSLLRLRNKKLQAMSRTIYNMKNKLRRENLAGRTMIQALFDEICEELLKQYEMMRHGTMQSTCTGHFMASMGLPCAHKMIEWKDERLPLDAIHSQWRIDIRSLSVSNGEQHGNGAAPKESAQGSISQLEHPSFPMLFEPTIQVHMGRPLASRKGKETSSTKRNSSQFEIIDAPQKCGICKAAGHNSRTCRDKLGLSVINPSYGVGIAYERKYHG